MNLEENKEIMENSQANEFLERAKRKGLDKDFLFTTTFNRYLSQIKLLNQLNNDFNNCETTISKEYVKGRETITAHPLITKINQTTKETNNTASLLDKIITSYNQNDIEISLDRISRDIDSYNYQSGDKYVLAKRGEKRGELIEVDTLLFL